MDPNEALQRIRALCGLLGGDVDDEAQELVDQVEALDEWLSQGGFLPEAWRAPIAARILRNAVTGEPDDKLMPEHGLDWADNGLSDDSRGADGQGQSEG